MKLIHVESCLRTDDEGRYFEECPYAAQAGEFYCTIFDYLVMVPKEGIHPDCPLEEDNWEELVESTIEMRSVMHDWLDALNEKTHITVDEKHKKWFLQLMDDTIRICLK